MSTRNFEFRVSPRHGQRGVGVLGGSTTLTSGVPVVYNNDNDGLGRNEFVLATGDQAIPKPGLGGILVFEALDYQGVDAVLNTYSDVDSVVPGKAIQVVTGKEVEVALINTTDTTFLNRTSYPDARIMVAGVSIATPTVAVGNYLTPGVGDGTSGYWAETSTAANGWLVVTAVDSDTGVVEARLNF